jgi:hypothetical protein
MNAAVLVPLLLAAGSAVPSPARADGGLPQPASARTLQVWLGSHEYVRGDRPRVYARAAEDGFLIVLHADAGGRVRILLPVDPHGSEYARGGETLEIRGRGDREAFLVSETSGSGVVLAAWSRDPFRYDELVRGDHWDYRALAPDGAGADAEGFLLDLVHWMADGRAFDYDVAHYVVRDPRSLARTWSRDYGAGCSYLTTGWSHRSSFHLGVGAGRFGCAPFPYRWYPPYGYDPFFFPFVVYRPHRPWYCDPWFGCFRPVPRLGRFDPFWYPRHRARPYHPVFGSPYALDPSGWHGLRFGPPGRGEPATVFRTAGAAGAARGLPTLRSPDADAAARRGGLERARTAAARGERDPAVERMFERLAAERDRRRESPFTQRTDAGRSAGGAVPAPAIPGERKPAARVPLHAQRDAAHAAARGLRPSPADPGSEARVRPGGPRRDPADAASGKGDRAPSDATRRAVRPDAPSAPSRPVPAVRPAPSGRQSPSATGSRGTGLRPGARPAKGRTSS